MKYFDAHTHLNLPEFDSDWSEVALRAESVGVSFLNIGTDLINSAKAILIAKAYPNLAWACVGLHPQTKAIENEQDQLADLAKNKEVVAIGECGFDRLAEASEAEVLRQRELLTWQLDLALKLNKPVMIHCREAYSELLTVLIDRKKTASLPLINMHFFAGDWTIAQQFLELGCYLSFTGVLTFTHDYDEVVKNMPLDRLLAETDAPYVTPVPYRGKRNEPAYVVEVVKAMAR
ncbi:hypothetical protein BK005_00230, partial [bacterium CG10_37_50]